MIARRYAQGGNKSMFHFDFDHMIGNRTKTCDREQLPTERLSGSGG
jgi:hypothetical protein